MLIQSNSLDDVAVDVLIVGAGPAGFMTAATLARYGVGFRMIDQRPERIQTGHAEGVQPRTVEVLQTLDLQYTLDCHGNHVCEAAFWPINSSGNLERTHVGPEVVHATPYPYILAVPQRETERAFDEDLNARGYVVDRPTHLLYFEYTNDTQYPIHALVKNKYSNATSVYRCKYLVGSDGAASTTRRILDIPRETSGHNDVWVVADMEFETDFPDVRRRSVIRSRCGAIMLIPNAGGGNRVYTQLSSKEVADLGAMDDSQSVRPGNRLVATDWKDLALLDILKLRLKENLKPYTGNIKKILWISQYQIRQRVIEEFSDHTLVLQGKMRPEVLETYNTERKQIAQELIEFDTRFSPLFAKKEFLNNNAEFHDVYEKAHGFTTGIGLHYRPNQLISSGVQAPINTASLNPLTPGKRFPPLTAIRHMDGTAIVLLSEMPSFGRLHLSTSSSSTRTPTTLSRLGALPAPLPDWKYRICADKEGKAHEDNGVDPEVGAIALVRPDGYVALVTGLEGGAEVTEFMDSFMVVPEGGASNGFRAQGMVLQSCLR
ncbi:hypothetical protein MMC18_001934 [Xylographa bjoerkii]|nr:hypothetical protein [Xylographa bjoerkii]